MIVILGLNLFHADSSACLVVDGNLVGAVAEERLGQRFKHSSAFPENAVRRLLQDAGLRLSDVTHVAVARDSTANYLAKALYVVRHPVEMASTFFYNLQRKRKVQSISKLLAAACREDPETLSFDLVGVEHHLAHIASAYFLSPFEGLTAGLSYDGSGDFVSLMAARCEDNHIEILDKVTLPDSLGTFYTALCQFIGFDRFGEEYKVMGLAPYGEDLYRKEMQELLRLEDEHWFKLGDGFFEVGQLTGGHHMDDKGNIPLDTLYTDKLVSLLGTPRDREAPVTQREMDIARSTQVRFEEAAVHCLKKLHKLVPTNQLVMAGGCALNGVANGRILRDTPFTSPYLQAASGDDGIGLGAAYYVWHHVLGRKERFHMKHAFWGPEYSHNETLKVAEASGYLVQVCKDDDELVEAAAELLADGLVMGWYQGRSEWGPRALGNRSILANPAEPGMKETINTKIKRRESFRPFAPSVLKEDVSTYFEETVDSPFMMHVIKIRPEWRERLPAVTHVDGTGRLQSVEKDNNPLYHKLISTFKKHTGIGMLLNTSYNENEPVVDTPQQAYDCFNRTDMDALCLGRCILKKPRLV